MGNERKLRLIQVAKEFKVGLNTITDFLQKKGIKSDGSPNTLVDAETYAVLEKEFGANRAAGNARESIRERISLKQTTITLEEAKKQEREEEKEVVIKSNVISVKDEIQQPKFQARSTCRPNPRLRRHPPRRRKRKNPPHSILRPPQHRHLPRRPRLPHSPHRPCLQARKPGRRRQALPHPQRRCMRRLLLRLPRLRPLNLRNPPHRPRRHPQRRLPGNRTPSPQKPRHPRRNRPLPRTTSSVRRP